MRPPGSGSTYEQDGRWYARLPPIYGRKVIGSYATQQEALDALDVTLAAILADGLKPSGPETLAAYGDRWLAIDDMGLKLAHFLQTDDRTGITESDAEQAILMLGEVTP